jgi:hypothetical protein
MKAFRGLLRLFRTGAMNMRIIHMIIPAKVKIKIFDMIFFSII